MDKMPDQLNQFYGRPGAQTSLGQKEQYGIQISHAISSSLGSSQTGHVNINGLEFDLTGGGERRETAEQKVRDIEMILNSPVGSFLDQDTKSLLTHNAVYIKKMLEELGDEYDAYYSMHRVDFLKTTNCVSILKETIKSVKGDSRPVALEFFNTATIRLEELGINQTTK